ncbi:MAG: nitronate monooxygenase [Microthrixaceae bacterium]
MSHDQMVEEMTATRALTDKPFGVDLLTAAPGDMEAAVIAIAEAGANAFVAGLGVPRKVVDLCHELGLLVINMCGRANHAIDAVDAGCDIVVAQGTEAGGHTGRVASFALIPQIVDAVGDRVPVVAAGAINDGRPVARCAWARMESGSEPVSSPHQRHAPSPATRIGSSARTPMEPSSRGLHGQDLPCDQQRLCGRVRSQRSYGRPFPRAGDQDLHRGPQSPWRR